jgi:D-arabinose 1-dehydrogenase-like Zn-dependent alcohol dehydrogenase
LVAAAGETILLPEGLDYELAAPVLCAGYTAWAAFRAARAGRRPRHWRPRAPGPPVLPRLRI